jgi:outer membrane lipoprotein-sorting protein
LNKDAMQKLGSPVEWLRHLAQEDGELIGDEVLNGRQTHVYRLKRVDYPLGTGKIDAGDVDKVWVDAESGLPVKIIAEFFDTLNHRHTRDVYDDFQWNKTLNTKLFSMDVPQGFIKEKSE